MLVSVTRAVVDRTPAPLLRMLVCILASLLSVHCQGGTNEQSPSETTPPVTTSEVPVISTSEITGYCAFEPSGVPRVRIIGHQDERITVYGVTIPGLDQLQEGWLILPVVARQPTRILETEPREDGLLSLLDCMKVLLSFDDVYHVRRGYASIQTWEQTAEQLNNGEDVHPQEFYGLLRETVGDPPSFYGAETFTRDFVTDEGGIFPTEQPWRGLVRVDSIWVLGYDPTTGGYKVTLEISAELQAPANPAPAESRFPLIPVGPGESASFQAGTLTTLVAHIEYVPDEDYGLGIPLESVLIEHRPSE